MSCIEVFNSVVSRGKIRWDPQKKVTTSHLVDHLGPQTRSLQAGKCASLLSPKERTFSTYLYQVSQAVLFWMSREKQPKTCLTSNKQTMRNLLFLSL